MSILKVRVPLTQDGQLITVEWLKLLQQIETGSLGGVDVTALSDSVALLASDVASLETDLAALTERVRVLEGGYQS
jgi:hypothetical protein